MLVFTFYSGLHFVPLPGSFIASQGLLNSSSTGSRELENRWVEGRRVGLGGRERDREKLARIWHRSCVVQGTRARKMLLQPWPRFTWATNPDQPSPAELGKTPVNSCPSMEVGFLCPSGMDESKWQHRGMDSCSKGLRCTEQSPPQLSAGPSGTAGHLLALPSPLMLTAVQASLAHGLILASPSPLPRAELRHV